MDFRCAHRTSAANSKRRAKHFSSKPASANFHKSLPTAKRVAFSFYIANCVYQAESMLKKTPAARARTQHQPARSGQMQTRHLRDCFFPCMRFACLLMWPRHWHFSNIFSFHSPGKVPRWNLIHWCVVRWNLICLLWTSSGWSFLLHWCDIFYCSKGRLAIFLTKDTQKSSCVNIIAHLPENEERLLQRPQRRQIATCGATFHTSAVAQIPIHVAAETSMQSLLVESTFSRIFLLRYPK